MLGAKTLNYEKDIFSGCIIYGRMPAIMCSLGREGKFCFYQFKVQCCLLFITRSLLIMHAFIGLLNLIGR